MGRLIFEDVFVPNSHIVRGVGRSLEVIKYSIGWERVMLMGVCIGPMTRVLKETIERVNDREQFGKPIGSYQQVSSKIAEMVVRLRLSRQCVYDLCGRPVIIKYEPDTPKTRALRLKAARHLLREAERDLEHSILHAPQKRTTPVLRRHRVRLRPESVERIRKSLDSIFEIIQEERVRSADAGSDARWYAWVSLLTPLANSND